MAKKRYTFFVATAKKEGMEQASAIFQETAEQESQHAKWLLRMINNIAKEKNIDPGKLFEKTIEIT